MNVSMNKSIYKYDVISTFGILYNFFMTWNTLSRLNWMYQNHFREFEKNDIKILELFKKYVIIFIIVSIYVIIIKFQVCIIYIYIFCSIYK